MGLKKRPHKITSAIFFYFFLDTTIHNCISLYLSGPSQSPRESAGASLGATDMPPVGSICANMTHSNRKPHANLNLPYARVLSANKTNTKGTRAWWYSIMRRGCSSVDTASHGSVQQRRYIQTHCPVYGIKSLPTASNSTDSMSAAGETVQEVQTTRSNFFFFLRHLPLR